jgi:hypothetical protein
VRCIVRESELVFQALYQESLDKRQRERLPGGKEIGRNALPHGTGEDEDLLCAIPARIAEQPLTAVRIAGNGDAVACDESGKSHTGSIVHGSAPLRGGWMVQHAPSTVMVVFGFRGTALPGGTSAVVPSGKPTLQSCLERFRIPAAPGMDG